MKIQQIETLLNSPEVSTHPVYSQARYQVEIAIQQVTWPPDSPQFTIYPERKGNGVKPIKTNFIEYLESLGWTREFQVNDRFGKLDAGLRQDNSTVVVEWETGNISSSHRAINKIASLIQTKEIIAGFLVVPCRSLAQYLTDRIGNFEELNPYFDFWKNCIACQVGALEIWAIEQDMTSLEVPKIPKGTDGRAKG
jgi:Restriction endonuclease BamHI